MAPDVLLPAETIGRDGEPIPVCWICAHLVIEHDVVLQDDGLGPHQMCQCKREVIFPDRTWGTLATQVTEVDTQSAVDLARASRQVEEARAALVAAERARDQAMGIRSTRVPARDRQAQARAAAALTRRRAG